MNNSQLNTVNIFVEKANYNGRGRKEYLRAFFENDGVRFYFTTKNENRYIDDTYLTPMDIMRRFLALRKMGLAGKWEGTFKMIRLY